MTNEDVQAPRKTYVPTGCGMCLWPYPQDVTKAGLIIPQKSAGETNDLIESVRCRVLAVGPDCKQVKEGDVVVLFANRWPAVKHRGQLTLVVREDSIGGVELPESDPLLIEDADE